MDYQNMDFFLVRHLHASEEANECDDGGGPNDQIFKIHCVYFVVRWF